METGSLWAVRPDVLESLSAGSLRLVRSSAGRPSRRGDVVVIPLRGILTPRGSFVLEAFGASPGGLEAFRHELKRAASDPDVERIVLDVDSPGGLVDGVPETADLIHEVAAARRVDAVANTEAASAAYWLASQAKRVTASPSAVVGSIGVYAVHESARRRKEQAGIDTTIISAGPRKVETHPDVQLSDSGRAQLQGLVDAAYDAFVRGVARGRGVSQRRVREGFGQGAALAARDALSEGLVDDVATLDQVVEGAASVRRGAVAEAEEPEVAAVEGGEVAAGPLAPHDTDTVDEPWEASAELAKIPDDAGASTLRRMHAWVDADPDTKAAYKFPHHKVVDGEPGPANLRAVRNGLARLSQASIPPADRAGVRRHLLRHLEAGREREGMRLVDELALAACSVGCAMERAHEVMAHRRLGREARELLAVIREVANQGARDDLAREYLRALRNLID